MINFIIPAEIFLFHFCCWSLLLSKSRTVQGSFTM